MTYSTTRLQRTTNNVISIRHSRNNRSITIIGGIKMSDIILKITEEKPTAIVDDFDTFIHYMKENSTGLTKTNEFIRRKNLYELNQKMKTHSIPNATPRRDQPAYPLLHLFYHLALAGKIFQKVYKGNRSDMEATERFEMYEELTATEKYFFLLETFWVDVNLEKIQKGCPGRESAYYNVSDFLEYVGKQEPGKKINIEDNREPYVILFSWSFGYFFLYFSFFGFWSVIRYKERSSRKISFKAKSITPSSFGTTVIPVLTKKREFTLWNLLYRRSFYDEWKSIPGSPLPGQELSSDEQKEVEPFFLPFAQLFPEGELQKTLPREGIQFVDGTYVFKVALRNNVWRYIEISADDTLLDLHNAIQIAYNFDDDHLYSFFMDGEIWSDEHFNSPWDDEGPFVDEVKIGELGLREGQNILYLFDYGDSWEFRVTLEELREEGIKPGKSKILKKKGKSPQQYPTDEE